jgi:hypothetical protein
VVFNQIEKGIVDRRRGFFLFGSFSFFKEGCGNVENSTGRPHPGYE